jgi:hypothetical protein
MLLMTCTPAPGQPGGEQILLEIQAWLGTRVH